MAIYLSFPKFHVFKSPLLQAEAQLSLLWGGWLGGAMVLGKLPVPGHPNKLDDSRARAYSIQFYCGKIDTSV